MRSRPDDLLERDAAARRASAAALSRPGTDARVVGSLARLVDIARAIVDIEGFVAGMDAASFAGDTRRLLAVQAALTVIGEAIKPLPEEIRRCHPDARWSGYARLREVIVHQYFRIEPGLLWKVVARNLLRLRDAVRREPESYAPRPSRA